MKKYSFHQTKRVKKSIDFQSAFEKGKVFKTIFFRAYVVHRGLLRPRLGVCVSKKLAKAFLRNRLKRVVRESFRKKEFISPLDFVFVLTVDGIKLDNIKLFQEVSDFLERFVHNFSTDVNIPCSSTTTVLSKKNFPS